MLAGTVETAVNALWDAAPRVGDRIAVSAPGWSASVAGCSRRSRGCASSWSTSTVPRAVADALGVGFATPDAAAGECDLVLHASATEAGLARSLELLGDEGEVIEMSWYGERAPACRWARPSTRGA